MSHSNNLPLDALHSLKMKKVPGSGLEKIAGFGSANEKLDSKWHRRGRESWTSIFKAPKAPSQLDRNIRTLSSSFRRALTKEEISRVRYTFKTTFQRSTNCTEIRWAPCYVRFTVSTRDPGVKQFDFGTIIRKTLNNLGRKKDFKIFFAKVKVTVDKTLKRPAIRGTMNTSTRQNISNKHKIDFFVPKNMDEIWIRF